MKSSRVRNIGVTIILALCFVATCVIFTACGSPKKKAVFDSSADAFGFAGATAGALLAGMDTSTTSSSVVNAVASTQDQKNIEIINKYIDIFDNVVGNNTFVSTKEHIDDVESEYNYKITTTITNLDGKQQTFEMYFTETKLDNTLVTDDDDDEIESKLSGKMIYEGAEYEIQGKKTIEEDEIEIEFFAYIDQENYIKIEQETENNEQEFEYTIHKNGLKETMSLEIEEERNEIEIEMQYNQDTFYKFKREGNELKITYRDAEGTGVIRAKINETGDSVIYTLQDGTTITKTRE